MRVYDIYPEASEYLGTNDQTHIFRTLGRACEYLATKGEWDVLKGYVDLPVYQNYFCVLPPQVETPLKFTIDDIPAFSRDRLYEFTLNGFGSNGGGSDRVDYTWEDRGFIPTQALITDTGFWVAVAPSADPNTQGKRIFLQGQDMMNNEVVEPITVDPLNVIFSKTQFKRLTDVNKEQTGAVVNVYRWLPSPATNDNFANAIVITGSDWDPANPLTGTTALATTEDGEPLPAAVNTVWYQWTGAGTSINAGFWTRRDFFIDVYTGTALDNLTLVGTSADTGTISKVVFARTAGTIYYIRVRPPQPDLAGAFTLGWREEPDSPPPGPPQDPDLVPPQAQTSIPPPGSLLISQYGQNDLNPRYRMVRLSVKGVTARFLFRRKTFKILSMDDFIPIQSELGFLTMLQAIQALRRKDFESAKASADAAVEMTSDAQRSTTGFIELANQTEVQEARAYNIYNRDTVIMLDIYDPVAKILGNVGQFKVFDATTNALEVLCTKGHYDGLTGYVDILTDGRRNVTLPRFVDQPVAISINGRPAYMRNKWSEFHLNGPGSDEYGGQFMGGTWQNFSGFSGAGRWGQISAWDSVGEVVTIRPLGCVSQLVAIPDLQDDDGKAYRIYGYDETGKWIRQDGQDGFQLEVNHLKLFPNANIDQKVARIERITRDRTAGFVRLWAFDAVTQTTSILLGYHYPDETEPKYFRIKIRADAQWVRLRYRKRTYKVTSVWQPLHLHSRLAIITMVRSLYALGNVSDPAAAASAAEALEQKAVKFLDDDQKARNPGETFQLQFNEDCGWNSNFIVS